MRKIAIITFARLPLPAVNGGAIETLLDIVANQNEKFNLIDITIFSVFNTQAKIQSSNYKNTRYIYYRRNQASSIFTDAKNRVFRKMLGSSVTFIPEYVKKLSEVINNNGYEYLLVEGGGIYVPYLYSRIQSPLIIHFHTDPLSYMSSSLLKEIAKNAKKVICVSDFVARQVLSVSKEYSDKISIVRNTTNIRRLSVHDYDAARKKTRKKTHLSNSDIVMMYCGRIDPQKGVKELLEATVSINVDNFKVLIVGGIDSSIKGNITFLRELKKIANTNPDRFYFTNYIPHESLPDFYAASDFVVVPSLCNEAASLTVIEATLMNLPLISTTRGGIPEYIYEPNTILIDPNDNFVEKLRIHISEMITRIRSHSLPIDVTREYEERFNEEEYYFNFVKQIEKN